MEDGEDSGDEAAFSIAAIKAKYKTGGNKDKKPIYSSDEDDNNSDEKPPTIDESIDLLKELLGSGVTIPTENADSEAPAEDKDSDTSYILVSKNKERSRSF